MRASFRLLFAFLLSLGFVAGASAQIELVKTAGGSNPKLHLTGVAGSDEIQKQLLDDIHFSDWFTLEADPKKAQYLLAGKWDTAGDQASLALWLTDSLGNQITSFKQVGTSVNRRQIVHEAMDTLISRSFNGNPGFCATKLAYVKDFGGAKELYIAEFDGAEPKRLTYNKRISTEPTWGPGARSLAYTLYNSRSTNVVYVDMVQAQQKPVARYRGLNSGPALSPDGRHLAMTLSRDGQVDLYVQDLSTATLKRLTNSPQTEASPCWSPDGKTICFVSDHASSRPTLYFIPATGGQMQAVLATREEAVSPDWSKQSGALCFSVRAGSGYAVAWIEKPAPGSQATVVTEAAGNWESPSWAADGRHMVCSRDYKGKKGLYLVDSYFKTTRELRNYAGDDTLPAYSDHTR